MSLREMVRETILEIVEKENDWIYAVQKRRTWYFDLYFQVMSFLGGHFTYMIAFPILFWFGFSQFARHALWLMGLGLIFCNIFKDLLFLPRPKHPVVPFSKKYSAEFGFPSSHSVNALNFPLFVAIYYLGSIEGEISTMTYATVWSLAALFCVSVCFSRIYCGMHSGIDILGGISVGFIIFITWMYNFDLIEKWMTTDPFAWLHSICFFLLIFSIYPSPPIATPSFEDSCCFAFACVGMTLGTCLTRYETWSMNYPHPSTIYYSFEHLGVLVSVARVALGITLIICWRAVSKFLLSGIALRGRHFDFDKPEKQQQDINNLKKGKSNYKLNKFGFELVARAIVYTGIGTISTYIVPGLFEVLGIGRGY